MLFHTWANPSVFEILKISISYLDETPFASVVGVSFCSGQIVAEIASGSVSLLLCICLCFCSGVNVVPLIQLERHNDFCMKMNFVFIYMDELITGPPTTKETTVATRSGKKNSTYKSKATVTLSHKH